MEMQTQALMLCLIFITLPMGFGTNEEPQAIEGWFQELRHAKEKVSKLHFYFHDIFSGKNPTAVEVAQANSTLTSPSFFGLLIMIDDPLTVGPEPSSKIVGRAQGFYGSADLNQVGLVMTINYIFTEGKFNGSALSILGRNPALQEHRELPIVGGTGVFRMARGVAMAKTYSFDPSTRNAVVEYNVVVIHY